MDSLQNFLEIFEVALVAAAERLYGGRGLVGEACIDALTGGGKRVRPSLLYLAGVEKDPRPQVYVNAALAVEWIHTASLIHDDLPAIDNDDLRRGRPSCHRRFGEGVAIVAADALYCDAFSLLCEGELADSQRLQLVRILASCAGGRGMCYGQGLDLYWTGRSGFTRQDLEIMHRHKTGRLMAAACGLGAVCAGLSQTDSERLMAFGEALGLVYQMVDDRLDRQTGTGKSFGKDQNQQKLTFLTLMSPETLALEATRASDAALELLHELVPRRSMLAAYANAILRRTQ